MMNAPVRMETVIDMNQQAIQFIFEGREESAKNLLVDCVEQAQRHLDEYKKGTSRANAHASLGIDSIALMGALGPEDDWHGYNTRRFCFYRFLFHVHAVAGDALNETDSIFLCATATYNLAMIHHHCGIVDDDLMAISRARSFYCVSLDLLTQDVVLANPESILLQIALYNNLGHLHSFEDDDDDAIQCQTDMRRIFSRNVELDPTTKAFFLHSLSVCRAVPSAGISGALAGTFGNK